MGRGEACPPVGFRARFLPALGLIYHFAAKLQRLFCSMLLLGCRACLFVAAAVAALAVMDASGNGGALLSRRWPPSDAEIKVLESKLGYFFKGRPGGLEGAPSVEAEQALPLPLPRAPLPPRLRLAPCPNREVDLAPGTDPPFLWRDEQRQARSYCF